jgi:GT2 family glycosyltransferase
MNGGRISAIVVTHNNERDISQCLASLEASTDRIDEIIVIDQDSCDGTADRVRREFKHATVLDFLDNPGFGEANNRGERVASGEYLLLLNPDATVERDCAGSLLEALITRPDVAIAVPKILLAREPSVINSAGLSVNQIGYGWDRGYLEWDRGQYDQPEPVLAGSGCALMVRTAAFRALGGFDPRYFLYYEDVDLCWRAWAAGFSVRYVPTAMARHAMKVSGRSVFFDEYLDHRNRLRTLLKNESARALVSKLPRVIAFEATSALDLIRRRQWRAARLRSQAWTWNIGRLADTLRHRRSVQRFRRVADDVFRPLFAGDSAAPRLDAAAPRYPEAYQDALDPCQMSSALVMGTNDIGMLGLGWYGLETIEAAACRWCGQYGIAFLRTPLETDDIDVIIRIRAIRPTEVAVRVNGEERGRVELDAAGWRDVSVRAPRASHVTRLDLFPNPTFRPSDDNRGARDRRLLGVAVAKIAVESCHSC